MKLKYPFVIREVAGERLAIMLGVPENETVGYVHLKAGGQFLFENLTEDTDEQTLTALVAEKYAVPQERAANIVSQFVGWLREKKLLQE